MKSIEVSYKNRLFGDVLRDIIYSSGENTYTFAKLVSMNNVMLSNFLNHKKYPGVVSLQRIAQVLPEEQRSQFICYFKDPSVKEESIRQLREKGISMPYSYSRYDKTKSFTEKFEEVDYDLLSSLQLQGLFKYLTEEEKGMFKNRIIQYIIERNAALQSCLVCEEDVR